MTNLQYIKLLILNDIGLTSHTLEEIRDILEIDILQYHQFRFLSNIILKLHCLVIIEMRGFSQVDLKCSVSLDD